MQKGHKGRDPPPPFAERQVLFILIIFRAENIAKSQPVFGWKIFRKFFRGNVSGVKEMPPILAEIEGEVLIKRECEYDVFGCKNSELF